MGQHLASLSTTATNYVTSLTNSYNNNNVNNTNNNAMNDSSNNNTSNNSSSSNNNGNSRGPYNPGRRRHNKKKLTKSQDLTQNELQRITYDVLCLIHHWFPRLHQQTYYLPPVHMNKVLYKEEIVGGTQVREIQKTPESDWRDDEVMQRTLCCVRALTDSRQEPMVVLLQVQHDNYLNKPCYAAAARMYPRPCDLPTNLKRGDFDLLFIHKHFGIIVAEIKSVGWRPGEIQDNSTVVKKVKQAVDQLNKAETVLNHLVKDLQPTPHITKTLILPNVSAERLLRLLQEDPQMAEDFRNCLNAMDVISAVSLCLCSQQMTSLKQPADVTTSILKELEEWWGRLTVKGGYCVQVGDEIEQADDVYELMVARFCGPASTVQVHCVQSPRLEFRTLGDAVQEVGERMIQFVLFPEQLAILQEEEQCVYLTGAPGTGKTLLLVLVALKWAREGKMVHVASTGTFSEAATQLLYYQVTTTLQKTDPVAASRIIIHLNNNSSTSMAAILNDLVKSASFCCASSPHHDVNHPSKGRELYVVADEVGEGFMKFYDDLHNNVPDLHIWAASYRKEHRPSEMKEKVVYDCLRSPPVVKRRMQTAISFDADGVHGYADKHEDYLGPSDGPAELFLSHLEHPHSDVTPAMNCRHCGNDVADILHNTLHVGKPHPSEVSRALKTPATLRYSDVIIIPDYYQNPDERDLEADLVRGLEDKGVPVYVVRKQDGGGIRDLARASRDAVAVVAWGVSNGLERKVVVSVGQGRVMGGKVSGVLHGASRCVSQLVYIECPESYVTSHVTSEKKGP